MVSNHRLFLLYHSYNGKRYTYCHMSANRSRVTRIDFCIILNLFYIFFGHSFRLVTLQGCSQVIRDLVDCVVLKSRC